MERKRIWKAILAGAVCFSLLSGCGNRGEETVDIPQSEKPQAEAGEVLREQGEAGEGPSWKKDTSPITIDWFVAYDWYGKVFDPVNNIADKKLQTETGITINVITGDTDKLNALIVSGELPDVVTFDAVASQRLQMEDAGLVLDLEELADNYAPDLNVPQSQKDWYRNEDGKWYSLVSFYYGPERCSEEFGGFLVTHNSNFVRTDLLEQIGMTMDELHTKEGFYQALKKVSKQKLQYDGMDVIPLTGVYPVNLAQQFGAQLEDELGNLQDIKLQPEYLEALTFYNKLYTEGLITTDEFTQDQTQRDQKVASGQVFMAQGWMTVKQPRSALYSSDPNAKMLYCGTIKTGNSGKAHYLSSINAAGWTTTMITASAEHADRIVTLFAYLTQEETALDEEYGSGCYDIVDGKAIRKEEAVKEYEQDYNAAYNKYNMNLSFAMDYTIIQKYENLDVENELEKDRINMERDKDAGLYDDKCFSDINPTAGTDLAAIKASIDEYWKSAEPQIIMASGEEECEKLYHQAVEQMYSMGYEELYEFQNEKFHKNKDKLGIEFAWPSLQK